ncbi:hypothetical protein MPSEU_000813000 [Mayamaea pseudoterrestris]|nr:hypothetical protein MPSEU_000813000 [Mayamaea pseudoterrestris]
MVAVGIAAVATWVGYSLVQRHYLNKGDFLAMQLLAETRQPYGDPTKVIPKLSTLPTIPELPKEQQIQLLAGDDDENDSSHDGTIYKCGDSLFCKLSRNQTSYSLFGIKPRAIPSLRQLVQKHSRLATVYEDFDTRYSYMQGIQQARTLEPTLVNASSVINGAYTFCFRDYVNFEEMLGMMIRRKGIEVLLLRLLESGKLVIDDEDCTMKEKSTFLLVIPLEVCWHGKLSADRIDWSRSSMRIGWEKFGSTIQNPGVAEKLRVDPWVVKLPKESYPLWDGSGDVLVIDRLGSGGLVFCRDKCLTPL